MRLLLCGDVVGRAGRNAIMEYVPRLRQEWKLDFVLVNGDNASSGFGINARQCEQFLAHGTDVITCGDHVWDQPDTRSILSQDKRVLRPHNFPSPVPGSGIGTYRLADGRSVCVLHLLGQVFIKEHLNCPFAAAEAFLRDHRLATPQTQTIIVDFHAEATSEKNAMGVCLDGRVSAVVGTHTHIPTADTQILPGGTAYQSDLGMCGDYRGSVIGFVPDTPLQMFRTKMRKLPRMQPQTGEATLCGLFVETDDATGLARRAEPVRLGGALATTGFSLGG